MVALRRVRLVGIKDECADREAILEGVRVVFAEDEDVFSVLVWDSSTHGVVAATERRYPDGASRWIVESGDLAGRIFKTLAVEHI